MDVADCDRLIEYLERKMCGPCRTSGSATHPACIEAAEFIELLAEEKERRP